jgi:hypothetical protein
MALHVSYRAHEAEAQAEAEVQARVQAQAAAAGQPYLLTLKNQSAQPWTFYVYQRMPGQSNDVFSLAWFASPFVITPGNRISFEWQIDYNFVWGTTGTVIPGITFNAGGEIITSPDGSNTTTFSTKPGPNLSSAVKAPPAGSLVIKDADDVPNSTYSVGIGMSGTGTFVVQAGPNLTHQFTPTPSYWIAAGSEVKVGTVLNIQTVTRTTEVKFPVSVYSQTRTLNESNIWV